MDNVQGIFMSPYPGYITKDTRLAECSGKVVVFRTVMSLVGSPDNVYFYMIKRETLLISWQAYRWVILQTTLEVTLDTMHKNMALGVYLHIDAYFFRHQKYSCDIQYFL